MRVDAERMEDAVRALCDERGWVGMPLQLTRPLGLPWSALTSVCAIDLIGGRVHEASAYRVSRPTPALRAEALANNLRHALSQHVLRGRRRAHWSTERIERTIAFAERLAVELALNEIAEVC